MRCFATYNLHFSAEPPIQNYTIKLPETVNAVQKELQHKSTFAIPILTHHYLILLQRTTLSVK